MKKKYFIVIGITIVIGIIGWFIYSFQASPKPLNVTVVGKASDQSIEFWRVIKKGLDAGAKNYKIKYKYVNPANEQAIDEQLKLLESAVSENPDGIILIPGDYKALSKPAQAVKANGIKMVLMDSGTDVPNTVLVATDNVNAGRKAGQELKKVMEPDKKIIFISHNEMASTSIERKQGVLMEFENENADLFTDTLSDCTDQEEAYEKAYEYLLNHSDIGGIIGLNEPSTIGAAMAVQALGIQSKIKIVGFDASIAEVKFLEERSISAVIAQKPFNMAYLSMEAIYREIKHIQQEDFIVTDTIVVTPNNIHDKEIQKSVFIFGE